MPFTVGLLRHLPYYVSHPNELSSKGLIVPGEPGPVSVGVHIKVLVHDSNHGCLDVAEDFRESVSARSPGSVLIYDAAEYLISQSRGR